MLSVLKQFEKCCAIRASMGGVLEWVTCQRGWRGWRSCMSGVLAWVAWLREWHASVSRVLTWLRGWRPCVGDMPI